MANVELKTDGTIQGTVLVVDGKNETADQKIVSISMWAMAPYKSKYSGDNIPGSVSCSYEYANGSGIIERRSFGTDDTQHACGIGEKMDNCDSAIVRHIGKPVDEAVAALVDKIVAESTKVGAKCPTKEILLSRSLVSLQDKASDLGIKVEEVPAKLEG